MMELDPQALETIINKKAEEFTNADIDALISHYRSQREQFALNEAAGKRANAKPKKAVDMELSGLLDGIL